MPYRQGFLGCQETSSLGLAENRSIKTNFLSSKTMRAVCECSNILKIVIFLIIGRTDTIFQRSSDICSEVLVPRGLSILGHVIKNGSNSSYITLDRWPCLVSWYMQLKKRIEKGFVS